MHQCEFAFYPDWCVRGVIDDYLAMKRPALSAGTLDDYHWRRAWLLEVLGETTHAGNVTFAVLERAARKGREALIKDVTIKARLKLWRAAAKYAAMRGIIKPDQVAEMPPWLEDDGLKGGAIYTLEQYQQFRVAVPPGRFRNLADLSMWTGMNTVDLYETERQHLDPDYVWEGTDWRGRWYRRNTKNANPKKKRRKAVAVQPCWIPMEPELREFALEWLAEPGAPEDRIVGPLNNVNRTFEAAAGRAGLHRIRPNKDFRASHSTLLMVRGWSYEYVRIVLGHAGEVSGEKVDGQIRAVTAKRPTTLSSHYLHPYAHPAHQHG